ncbi:MAG: GGDEF domain-containing protein [Pyrinomonadaceae bacterium]
MDAGVGLAIQCVGIVLVAVLSYVMMRSIEGVSQRYWTIAWSCLSISLSSLIVAFHTNAFGKLSYSLYFLGEYAFGYMFVAGCRYHASKKRLTRRDLIAIAPGLFAAALLPHLSDDFNNLFIVQASIMAALFATAFYALRHARRQGQSSPGLRVMMVALFLLALDFSHYVPVFSARSGMWGLTVPAGYLKYTSIFDLILEILLGFGTVMVGMEGVRQEVEATNMELMAVRDKLELLARVDPLTDALNRHALHSLRNNKDESHDTRLGGCVVVIDLDDLKTINDTHGHTAGDAAIRAVAHAARSLIRADDMLFRWGGDEFLILMFGMPEAEAARRFNSLNALLTLTPLPSVPLPVNLKVSHGLASFNALDHLDQAIEQADEAMYRHKQTHKEEKKEELLLNMI